MRRIATLAGLLGAAVLASPASAATTAVVSSNWAGYVAHDGRRGFRSVSASWTVPAASCSTAQETHSAVWVGLGGYRRHASALEQIGTDTDCASSGRASYSSWVELLPAAARTLSLKVRPGDVIAASVTVVGHHATLRLRDLTSGRRYSTTRRVANIDVSTADWILEAPSSCDGNGHCHTLQLTNFGTVGFTAATATAAGHTVELGAWPATELVLRQDVSAGSGAAASTAGTVTATPSALSTGAFSIAYGESAATRAPEAPALPGAEG